MVKAATRCCGESGSYVEREGICKFNSKEKYIPVSKLHDHEKGKVKKVRDTKKKRKCARSCRRWDLD